MRKLLIRGVSVVERMRMWLLRQSWFESKLLPALPRQLRWLLRVLYLAPIDLVDRLLGRHDPGLPPKAGTFTGAVDDFAASGVVLVEALESIANVTPSSRVLDVGCGVGRLAIPMSRFLDVDGRYEGFDIVPKGILWCQKHVVGPHGNIHFTLADVYNREYNPRGRVRAADYRFPYDDGTVDVAVLVSVFTHMLPDDVDHYVNELSRVLTTNGRMVATYYLITPESLTLMNSTKSNMQFTRNVGPYWLRGGRTAELAIAYDEPYIRAIYAKHGFSDPPTLYAGGWCGRSRLWPAGSGLGGQDLLVATKL